MEWCDERGGKEEAELITSESSIPVFSSKLSHFLALLHGRFLWGPISRSLSLSQGQRGAGGWWAGVKNGCCAAQCGGWGWFNIHGFLEWSHSRQQPERQQASLWLSTPPPVQSHHSPLSLLLARSLSAPAMLMPVYSAHTYILDCITCIVTNITIAYCMMPQILRLVEEQCAVIFLNNET